MNRTEYFLDSINEFHNMDIPEHVTKRAKMALFDYICVTLAGAKYNHNEVKRLMEQSEPDSGNSKVIGFENRMPLKDAVFLNGLNSHALDFDDGTNEGIIHLGSPVFSVLLPLADKYDVDSETLFRAIVTGYETSFTMACSIQPELKKRGYHATGVCGILGSTLAVAYMMDFSERDRKNAFSAACLSATGTLKALDGDSQLKPFNVARTSLMALVSAQMAMAGFCGPDDPLDGDRGYLAMMIGRDDVDLYKPFKDNRYAVEKAYIKPYAACRYCHPAIECALKLREEMIKGGIAYDDIAMIDVRTYDLAVRGHDHCIVPNVSSSKMSIPFSVCVALVAGNAGLREYTDEMIENDSVQKLLKIVTVKEDDSFSAVFPKKQVTIVSIHVNDGILTERVEYPKGEPENPFSEGEFKDRCMALCEGTTINSDSFSEIYNIISSDEFHIKSVMNLL